MHIQFLGADDIPLTAVLVSCCDYWEACDKGHSMMETIEGAVDFQVISVDAVSSNDNERGIHAISAARMSR